MSFGGRAHSYQTRNRALASTCTSALIVDDSQTMRAILHDMLLRLGVCAIEEAEDVASAISHLQRQAYSIIISDWHMEPLDGLELLKEVRRISRPGQNRFIFSTTERSWGSQTSARLEGAEAFLVKPFTIEMLCNKITEVLA